ncbi:Di-trans-poly-cis-decaprenylcistransferase [Gigaspora margarita]|uniref:Alkyl transferase n=1 Tax=Gigaspora margarita TaxID=4874 RepID=A0A8H3XNZ9_GIGMA|nr:Di-trans-poly-cis-decaprenylcistransferase [Gigaspora margarita]
MPPSDFTDTNQNETPSLKATPNFLTSPVNYTSHHVQSLLLKILKQGPIPQHIGFIMDGNRRFARKMNYKQVVEGHFMGYDKLQEVLNICLHLGVKVVTIYAFSIENFKRPKEEVDTLMELAKTKFIELCEKSHLVNKYDLCVRILGNIALLPVDVQDAAKKAVETTKNNTGSILNICVPYTSRDEITSSIKSVIKSVENGHMQIRDINEEIIEKCLYTYGSPPLNILIRTSGEIRLSDFLLWQCHKNCYIHFVDCFWPEFSLWEMLPIILEYQLSHNSLKEKRSKSGLQIASSLS